MSYSINISGHVPWDADVRANEREKLAAVRQLIERLRESGGELYSATFSGSAILVDLLKPADETQPEPADRPAPAPALAPAPEPAAEEPKAEPAEGTASDTTTSSETTTATAEEDVTATNDA